MKSSKERYENHCVICDRNRLVDGAHLFDRGKTKYMYLAATKENIIPLCRSHHRQLDFYDAFNKRKPWAKVRYILKYAHPDHRSKVMEQFINLKDIIKDGHR